MKQKIAFALIMGVITTGIISFTLISINFGYGPKFLFVWLKSWMIAYLVAIPVILLIAPKVQIFVERMFADKDEQDIL
jgi:hypothetical protein